MDAVESYADLGRRLWRRGTPNAWGDIHGPACRCLPCADLRAVVPTVCDARPIRHYPDEHGWKVGAARLGITFEAYRARVLDGQRWCYGHHRWESRHEFGIDRRNRDGMARACSEVLAEQSRRSRERRIAP